MITINKRLVYDHYEYDVRCKSTDEKPIDLTNGTPLIEIDTGKKYLFDGETGEWSEVSSSLIISANGVEF